MGKLLDFSFFNVLKLLNQRRNHLSRILTIRGVENSYPKRETKISRGYSYWFNLPILIDGAISMQFLKFMAFTFGCLSLWLYESFYYIHPVFLSVIIITMRSKKFSDQLAMLFQAVITFSETKQTDLKKCLSLLFSH